MTSWYVPRLKVFRIRSATPQRKLTISLMRHRAPTPFSIAPLVRALNGILRADDSLPFSERGPQGRHLLELGSLPGTDSGTSGFHER